MLTQVSMDVVVRCATEALTLHLLQVVGQQVQRMLQTAQDGTVRSNVFLCPKSVH